MLYIHESGGFDRRSEDLEHVTVGGLAIHECTIERFRTRVDDLMAEVLDPPNRELEIHAAAMTAGRGPWRKMPRPVRFDLLHRLSSLLGSFPSVDPSFGLLAVARAPLAVPAADPLERVFEELLLRFRSMLDRMSREDSEQFGIVIADEAKYERILQPLVAEWRHTGIRRRRLGRLDRLVEVPLFVDSKTTRLLQMADLVAHSVWRFYERRISDLVGPMLPGFYADSGVMHGLVHLVPNYQQCPCPACVSRIARLRLRADRVRSYPRQSSLVPTRLRGPLLPGDATLDDRFRTHGIAGHDPAAGARPCGWSKRRSTPQGGVAAGWLPLPAGRSDRQRPHERRSLSRDPRTDAVGAVYGTGVARPGRPLPAPGAMRSSNRMRPRSGCPRPGPGNGDGLRMGRDLRPGRPHSIPSRGRIVVRGRSRPRPPRSATTRPWGCGVLVPGRRPGLGATDRITALTVLSAGPTGTVAGTEDRAAGTGSEERRKRRLMR